MLTFLRCDQQGRPIPPKPRPSKAARPASARVRARNDELLALARRLTVAEVAAVSGLALSTAKEGLAEARRRAEARRVESERHQAAVRKARERDWRWHQAAAVVSRGDASWLPSRPG
jgi:hypothetical protein